MLLHWYVYALLCKLGVAYRCFIEQQEIQEFFPCVVHSTMPKLASDITLQITVSTPRPDMGIKVSQHDMRLFWWYLIRSMLEIVKRLPLHLCWLQYWRIAQKYKQAV